jgi:hypothetical protein
VYAHIATAIKLFGQSMSMDEMKKREDEKNWTPPPNVALGRMERIFYPDDLNRIGSTDLVPLLSFPTNTSRGVNLVAPSGIEDEGDMTSLFELNNIHPRILHNLNFSNVSTLVEIMEAMKRNGERQVEAFDADPAKENCQPEQHPISDLFLLFLGDMSPIVGM